MIWVIIYGSALLLSEVRQNNRSSKVLKKAFKSSIKWCVSNVVYSTTWSRSYEGKLSRINQSCWCLELHEWAEANTNISIIMRLFLPVTCPWSPWATQPELLPNLVLIMNISAGCRDLVTSPVAVGSSSHSLLPVTCSTKADPVSAVTSAAQIVTL